MATLAPDLPTAEVSNPLKVDIGKLSSDLSRLDDLQLAEQGKTIARLRKALSIPADYEVQVTRDDTGKFVRSEGDGKYIEGQLKFGKSSTPFRVNVPITFELAVDGIAFPPDYHQTLFSHLSQLRDMHPDSQINIAAKTGDEVIYFVRPPQIRTDLSYKLAGETFAYRGDRSGVTQLSLSSQPIYNVVSGVINFTVDDKTYEVGR